MKKITIGSLINKAQDTFLRFPLSLLLTVALCLALMDLMRHNTFYGSNTELVNLSKVLYVGLLLSLCMHLYLERNRTKLIFGVAASLLVLLFCIFYYYDFTSQNTPGGWIRYAVTCISLHLLVAIAGHRKADGLLVLWQFNKSLFLRILLSFLYSSVLYLGLAIALVAIDKLLQVSLPKYIYADLWVLVSVLFNTWFFLAGVPAIQTAEANAENENVEYPRGLKIFTANILLPLVAIYLVILYLYLFRLIAEGNWSGNWISAMILAMAVFGILSFLLLHPLFAEPEYPWLKKVSKIFYALVIPLAVLTLLASLRNLSHYGFTETRYLLFVLSIWLLVVATFSFFKPAATLRIIPLSLVLIGLLSCFGPWNMSNIALQSQLHRLETIMDQNDMLWEGKINPDHPYPALHTEDLRQIRSIANYLCINGHFLSMQGFIYQDLNKLTSENSEPYQKADALMDFIEHCQKEKLTPATDKIVTEPSDDHGPLQIKKIQLNPRSMISVKNYDYLVDGTFGRSSNEWANVRVQNAELSYRYVYELNIFELKYLDFPILKIELGTKLINLFNESAMIDEPERLSFSGKNKNMKATIVITSLQLNKIIDISASDLQGKILIKLQ